MSRLSKVISIISGSFILAVSLYQFNYQNNITEGGVLGFILLMQAWFLFPPAITSLVVDVSLFLLGASSYGRSFLTYSLLATVSFSIFYTWNEHIGFVIPSLQNQMLLAAILSGVGVGIGVGLVVRTGAAAGGDDVLALIIQEKTPLKIGHVYLIVDLIILGASLTYLSVQDILYSLLAVIISGRTINYIFYQSDQTEI